MNLNIKLNKYRSRLNEEIIDTIYDDDNLAPVMPAIDAVRQLMEEENRNKTMKGAQTGQQDKSREQSSQPEPSASGTRSEPQQSAIVKDESLKQTEPKPTQPQVRKKVEPVRVPRINSGPSNNDISRNNRSSLSEINEEDEAPLVRVNPLHNFIIPTEPQDEYEFIPKSVILDVYSNDPEVKRFLKQLPKIYNETGYNEQDYKCYSCRRPIGLVFGQSRLCHFDGHQYCSECHLVEKSVIPARILCNWDFNKYPVSKRNQHLLTLISNEPMFELKKAAPLLYKMYHEMREIEELRRQAFFVRSYCITCVQDSIAFELTKLIWPREHLIKQTDLYSLDDLTQIKNGSLKQVLKNVITFGRQHVLSCVLCCQKGFICELCKSSQIIYPFDTESVHRCNDCQSTYHKVCFNSKPSEQTCPRCQRLKARARES